LQRHKKSSAVHRPAGTREALPGTISRGLRPAVLQINFGAAEVENLKSKTLWPFDNMRQMGRSMLRSYA
jgi:hypothetical protein